MKTKTLESLNKVSLKFENINEFVIGGSKSLTLVLSTSQFLKKEIPNKANTREFTGNKNKSVKEMITTLKTEPEMFRLKNLGIRMVATDYIRKNDEITLFFDEDEGIFNGGHTYKVLKEQGRDKAYINVAVDLGLPKDKLAEISIALNMSKKVEDHSAGEKRGEFEWIKQSLPNETMEYKEGDAGEYSVKDILKVANIFKTSYGKDWSKNSLSHSLRNQGQILKDNSEKQVLQYTRFILSDMWDIYKTIRGNEDIVKNMPSRMVRSKKIGQGLSLVMISGARAMVEINKNSIPVWKSGYNKEVALKLCEKISKQIGKELNKKKYDDVSAETISRDTDFHRLVQLAFLNELNSKKQ